MTEPTTQAAHSGTCPSGCPAADLRTAARVVRWIKQTAEKQVKALPWWKRMISDYPEDYLNLMVCNLEAMADKQQNMELSNTPARAEGGRK